MDENSQSPRKRAAKKVDMQEPYRSPTKRMLTRSNDENDERSTKLRKKNDTSSTPVGKEAKPTHSSTPAADHTKKHMGLDLDMDNYIAEMSGRSWAELVEESFSERDTDTESNAVLRSPNKLKSSVAVASKATSNDASPSKIPVATKSRKQTSPKKRTVTRPKFMASLEPRNQESDDSRPPSASSTASARSRLHKKDFRAASAVSKSKDVEPNDSATEQPLRRSPRKLAVARRQLQTPAEEDTARRSFPNKSEHRSQPRRNQEHDGHSHNRSYRKEDVRVDLRELLDNKSRGLLRGSQSGSSSRRCSTSSSPAGKGEDWQDPKMGWCNDETVKARREKEILKAKEKTVYKRYTEQVLRKDRVKSIDPVTPNRFLNWPRRSWDAQMRQWKRKLYIWAGDGFSQTDDSSSLNSSFNSGDHGSSETTTEGGDIESVYNSEDDEDAMAAPASHDTRPVLSSETVQLLMGAGHTTDGLDSALGGFDIDSRHAHALNAHTASNQATLSAHADDNTLTGDCGGKKGPSDFSVLKAAC